MIDLFRDRYEAHDHSLRVLELIYCYDSFMDSITTVADMGCGQGMDIKWWAENYSRDEPPLPRNYVCYAVDKDISQIDKSEMPKNVNYIEGNFETITLPRKMDMVWSHNSFQYAVDPVGTLRNWNKNMEPNGMLALTVPQMTSYVNNRLVTRSHNGVFFNHNVLTLLYMLGVTGFDCKDMYVYKVKNNPWIHIVTYKTGAPLEDPTKVTWSDLVEQDLVNDSIKKSVEKFGYARQEDLIFPWVDKNFYFVED